MTLLKLKIEGQTGDFLKPEEIKKSVLDDVLEKHLTRLGYPVGVRNIMDLDETGFAEARNNSFGASDSAVLLEVAYSSTKVPMKTKDELLYEKVNNVWNTEIGELASVRKGKELEDIIINKLEKVLNAQILKPSHMYINERGLATNFDGIIFKLQDTVEKDWAEIQPIPFEIKLCSFFGRKNYNWAKGISEFTQEIQLKVPQKPMLLDGISIKEHVEMSADWYGIPKYYYTQLQQQIAFTESPYGFLGVMDDINWEIYIYIIPRDDRTIKAIFDESFHQYARLCKQKHLSLPE